METAINDPDLVSLLLSRGLSHFSHRESRDSRLE